VFEAASALGTVGLSMGITGGLTDVGKLAVTLLMFLGRVGPLTIGLALIRRAHPPSLRRIGDLAV
jgi:trk system potassium uptake protein TrkH